MTACTVRGMRTITTIIALAVLSGCSVTPPPKPQWRKAGGDQKEVLQCELEAEKAAVSSDPNALVAAFEKADKRKRIMDLCMRSKGWTL